MSRTAAETVALFADNPEADTARAYALREAAAMHGHLSPYFALANIRTRHGAARTGDAISESFAWALDVLEVEWGGFKQELDRALLRRDGRARASVTEGWGTFKLLLNPIVTLAEQVRQRLNGDDDDLYIVSDDFPMSYAIAASLEMLDLEPYAQGIARHLTTFDAACSCAQEGAR